MDDQKQNLTGLLAEVKSELEKDAAKADDPEAVLDHILRRLAPPPSPHPAPPRDEPLEDVPPGEGAFRPAAYSQPFIQKAFIKAGSKTMGSSFHRNVINPAGQALLDSSDYVGKAFKKTGNHGSYIRGTSEKAAAFKPVAEKLPPLAESSEVTGAPAAAPLPPNLPLPGQESKRAEERSDPDQAPGRLDRFSAWYKKYHLPTVVGLLRDAVIIVVITVIGLFVRDFFMEEPSSSNPPQISQKAAQASAPEQSTASENISDEPKKAEEAQPFEITDENNLDTIDEP